ncbi:hypothetical protein GYB22_12660 [bacterium]|nr:hypothetical protein [bacterium]
MNKQNKKAEIIKDEFSEEERNEELIEELLDDFRGYDHILEEHIREDVEDDPEYARRYWGRASSRLFYLDDYIKELQARFKEEVVEVICTCAIDGQEAKFDYLDLKFINPANAEEIKYRFFE